MRRMVISDASEPVQERGCTNFGQVRSAFLMRGSQRSTLTPLHVVQECHRAAKTLQMALTIRLLLQGIETDSPQLRSHGTDSPVDVISPQEIGDYGPICWMDGPCRGVCFRGEIGIL
jgi:hypothetical protein